MIDETRNFKLGVRRALIGKLKRKWKMGGKPDGLVALRIAHTMVSEFAGRYGCSGSVTPSYDLYGPVAKAVIDELCAV